MESWILSVLNCGKRLEAMKLVITSVRPRTRLLEQGGGGGAEQALGFASLYYNRHRVNIIVINIINSIITSSNMAVTIPLKTELLGLFLL